MDNEHAHLEYEARFKRIESIIETIATLTLESRKDWDKWREESEKRWARIEVAQARFDEGLAEAADKLNGLIDLMDRHQREHGNH